MENSGTTLMSALVMSTPGYFGGFELGLLLARNVDEWSGVHPFHEWIEGNWKGYNRTAWVDTKNASCHAMWYSSLMESEPIRLNKQVGIIDKTPGYIYKLDDVMLRAPGIPVIVTQKSAHSQRMSWEKRGVKPDVLEERMSVANQGLARAQALFPNKIKVIETMHDLEACAHEHSNNESTLIKPLSIVCQRSSIVLQDVFRFLGLPLWQDKYFTLENYHTKCCVSGFKHCCPSTGVNTIR